jgi:hypothetical protein
MKPKIALATLALAFAPSLLAAPFCAVFSYGKQCYFHSLADCQSAAGSQGACVVNQSELKPPTGSTKFCVVTSWGTQCHHFSAESCRQAAASSGGACVVRTD